MCNGGLLKFKSSSHLEVIDLALERFAELEVLQKSVRVVGLGVRNVKITVNKGEESMRLIKEVITVFGALSSVNSDSGEGVGVNRLQQRVQSLKTEVKKAV